MAELVPVLCLELPTELLEFCHDKPGDGLVELFAQGPVFGGKVDIGALKGLDEVAGNDEDDLWPPLGLAVAYLFPKSQEQVWLYLWQTNRSKLGWELCIVVAQGQELFGEVEGREEFDATRCGREGESDMNGKGKRSEDAIWQL